MANDSKIKTLWEEFYKNTSFSKLKTELILNKWKEYKSKLEQKNLNLEEYTNNKSEKYYFTYFIERESSYFGSSRCGNSKQYMIYKIKDSEKFYINSKYLKPSEGKEGNLFEEKKATEIYKEHILPLLSNLAKINNFNDLLKIENSEEFENYQSKQLLRKIAVLNSLEENGDADFKLMFLFIYQDKTINRLYEKIVGNGNCANNTTASYFQKNKEILDKVIEILQIERSVESIKHISELLWDLENAKEILSENSPNIIFYGAPGTGKTYTVKKMIKRLCSDDIDAYEWVQFHPSFAYEDFIDGIKPVGIEDGKIEMKLVNGVFKDFCIRAKKYPEKKFYFVADEINRANVSSVFGEVLSCLEKDYRDDPESQKRDNLIKTQNSALETKEKAYFYDEVKGAKFGIPKNLYFIGMMNDTDKTIDSFDLAFRRRFNWIRMECDYDVLENYLTDIKDSEKFIKNVEKLNEYISKKLKLGKSFEFGHSFFMNIDAYKDNDKIDVEKLFNERLLPNLTEYLRTFFSDEDEIENKLKEAKNIFCGQKESCE